MRRSAHIAVYVPIGRREEAANHYKDLFGLEEKGRNEESVELEGPNFMLFVEESPNPVVLQEFVDESPNARSRFERAGCQIFGEWDGGFHVRDPYGMSFHVWTQKDKSPDAP
jgi:hypothetical protein